MNKVFPKTTNERVNALQSTFGKKEPFSSAFPELECFKLHFTADCVQLKISLHENTNSITISDKKCTKRLASIEMG